MTGFYTDQCVSASARDLTDLGSRLTLVDDAMGAMSPKPRQNALQSIRKRYTNSESPEDILPRLDQIAAKLTKKKRGWLSGRHGR